MRSGRHDDTTRRIVTGAIRNIEIYESILYLSTPLNNARDYGKSKME